MSEVVLEPAAPAADPNAPVLEIEDLHVTFSTEEGEVQAVRGIDLQVYQGEVLGIVGESGSGKSVTMLATMGLLPNTATISGSARFRGRELLGASAQSARSLRGGDMAMIFQDPLTALNPVHKVGQQIAEIVGAHHPEMNASQIEDRTLELLDLVGIPQPPTRARQYPHEFSGGMRQRAMIAMAIANDPALLIADEPTTALDVTIQAQILEVIDRVQQVTGTAIVFITHDLGVIARLADRVQVMYAGKTAEIATVDDLYGSSTHPYTRGLIASLPKLDEEHEQLTPIPGAPPSMLNPPPGCAFHPRCPLAQPKCAIEVPELRLVGEHGGQSACHFADVIDEQTDSVDELPEVLVEEAIDKSVLAEVAESVVEKPPPRRLSLMAVIGFVLGVATPIVALILRDEDVIVRGLLIMAGCVPAVFASRAGMRACDRGKGRVYGRALARLGWVFAWIGLVVWAAYCVGWVLANALPEAEP
jgi:oligopeptide/dipeptide ABC transporter ATP-binding protein